MAVLGIVGTVLMTLLKVVLILLLLVLAVILLVLFVPVRYGVWLEKEDSFSVQARASWLCHLVSFRMFYEKGKPELTLRVFGFNLLAWLQRKREKAGRDLGEEADTVEEDIREIDDGQGAFVKMDLGKGEAEETDISMAEARLPEHGKDGGYLEDIGEERTVGKENPVRKDTIGKNFAEKNTAGEKCLEEDWAGKNLFAGDGGAFQKRDGGFCYLVKERLRRFWREILRRLRAIADFFKGLWKIGHKLRKRAEWLGEVKDFWRSENTRQMVCIFRDNVLHLWRKLKPRTVKGQVWFGTGDPCSTGQVLGVCAMLFACYGNGVAVTPDFERQILEGKLMLKGRLSLITAVVILVKVFFSRQWKTFRREWNVIGGSLNE